MLVFRYLIVVDETFTVEDNRGARQFLSEVLTGFPAVDVGYLVRYSRFLPLINAPLTGDFVSPPSVGPAMVTTYRHFFSEKPWLAALRQPKRVDGVQEGERTWSAR